MYEPIVVRESAPITTPSPKLTAIMEVCLSALVHLHPTYTEVDLA